MEVKIESGFFFPAFYGINTDFFIIFFKDSRIFSSFGKLTLLHALSDIPVHKSSPLGIHQVEFVIEPGED